MREGFEINPQKPKRTGLIFVLVFIVILAAIGVYVFGASTKKSVPIISPTPTQAPTLIPVITESEISPTATSVSPTAKPKTTPSPTPKTSSTERSSLEITVLNGSGTAGAAKNISSYLEGLGYTIKSVGNADNYNYEGLTVNVSKEKSSYLTMLKKDLAEKSSSISAQVVSSLTVDAEVIIGK